MSLGVKLVKVLYTMLLAFYRVAFMLEKAALQPHKMYQKVAHLLAKYPGKKRRNNQRDDCLHEGCVF
eukprot:11906464-Ditylum_brightwellii.AAC.1